MGLQHTVTVIWQTKNTAKTNNEKHELNKDMVHCLHRKINQSEEIITHITVIQER